MTNEQDKKISDLYKQAGNEQPSSQLDNAILAAAHQEAPKKTNVSKISPFSSRWTVPVSLAATVILSIGVVLTIPDSDFQQPVEQMVQMPESVEEPESAATPAPAINLEKQNKSELHDVIENRQALKSKEVKKVVPKKKKSKVSDNRAANMKKNDTDQSILARKKVLSKKYKPQQRSSSEPAPIGAMALETVEEDSQKFESKSELDTESAPASSMMAPARMRAEQSPAPAMLRPDFEMFKVNLEKVTKGMNKKNVIKLLGMPVVDKNTYWKYRFTSEGKELNYVIRFRKDVVIKIEKPN